MIDSPTALGKLLKERFHMTFTAEELEELFKEVVGSTQEIARQVKSNAFERPSAVVFSPMRLYRLAQPYLFDPVRAAANPRVMKVLLEEVVPVIYFDLALARLGYGRHEIFMREGPDVALVKLEPKRDGKFDAVPVEVTTISQHSTVNSSSAEADVAQQIIRTKFNKQYPPQTILLVAFRKNISWLDTNKLTGLLCTHSPFNAIWAFVAEDEMCKRVRLIRICPPGQEVVISEEELPELFW